MFDIGEEVYFCGQHDSESVVIVKVRIEHILVTLDDYLTEGFPWMNVGYWVKCLNPQEISFFEENETVETDKDEKVKNLMVVRFEDLARTLDEAYRKAYEKLNRMENE